MNWDWDLHSGGKGNERQLPPGKGVFIEHNGCTCFAYLDAEGNWRDYYDGDLLNGKVKYEPD